MVAIAATITHELFYLVEYTKPVIYMFVRKSMEKTLVLCCNSKSDKQT